MKKHGITFGSRRGFSLAELLATLTIAAMITVAIFMIYDNAKKSAALIDQKLEKYTLPREILQRIAEDLDRLGTPGADTKITIENKYDSGFPTARLTITNRIYDSNSRPQVFEKVVWQTNYDPDMNRLMLYRSHSGITLEDKLLSGQEADWKEMGMELFVPLCTGVTFFRIQAVKGEQMHESWTAGTLPPAILATISFAEPFESPLGGLDVLEEEKISRTIVIDRTRKIKFIFVKNTDETE